ncbi:beta strand repeat-containing protein [Tsuneonella troitsensis]|uniref:beta strand repeat-containing protein n=1 Tax=Tsuneonella troitsensis TaxID=292222 RepID=UPI0009FB54C7|nr:VCBS domain-containing protein [Tsuneonella troitsensis]
MVDDLPTALNDGPFGVVEDGVSNVAGNVLTNDASGADTPKSFTAWSAGNAAEIADLNVYGTLTLNPDGSYSYVLDNSRAATQALTAADLKTYTLDYTMQDADGDVSPATLTITITGANDGATVVTAAANGPDNTVFESGLNPNGSQAAGNGETSTGTFTVSATDGIATVTIGGTVFTLAQVQAFGTTNGVVDTGEGTLTLTGYTGSATSGTVSYSYTLKATIDNDSKVGATGTEFDDAIALSVAGLGGTAAGDTLVVRIVDDLPTANAGPALTVVETAGPTAGTNLLANDVRGADGATLTHVNLGSGFVAITSGTNLGGGNYSFIVVGKGTYVFNADGSWSFDPVPVNNVGNADVDASFNYRITDGDLDTSEALQSVKITDGPGPQAGTDITLTVDDENLADGTSPAVPVTDADAIVFTAGSDPITTIAFANDLTTLDSSNLTWTRVSDTQIVGKDTGSGLTIVTLDLVKTGNTATVTATLSDNYDAHPGINADDLKTLGYVNVIATDSDGDEATNRVNVEVSDDVPTNFTPEASSAINTGTAVISNKLLDTVGNNIFDNDGADGIGSIRFAASLNGTKLTGGSGILQSGGQDIFLYVQPNGSLIASTDANPGDGLAPALTVFTATIDPITGTYTIDFDRPIDNGSGVKISDFSATKAGQNQWNGVDPDLVNGSAIDIAAANDPNPNSTDILFTPSTGGTINTSATDIGVSNQWIDAGEALRVDFVQDLRRDPGLDEANAGGYLYDTHSGVTQATFTVVQAKSTATVRITASNVDDTNATSQSNVQLPGINTAVNLDHTTIIVKNAGGTTLTAGVHYTVYDAGNAIVISGLDQGDSVTFGAQANATFEAFTVENVAGGPVPGGAGTLPGDDFALGAFAYNFTAIGAPISFSLPVVLTDGDGDTSTGSIAVTLNPVTPVVLDLDGDGAEFVDSSAGAVFDYNGDGNGVATAWASSDDALLAIDANGNGTVDGGAEIVFGGNGLTDLEGLAARYGDILDANDADFAKFGVWQDLDGDGVSDAGEFRTLSDAGIVSISLKSDGNAYKAADGEVHVFGTSTFTRADGSTGSVADAAFATKAKDSQRTAELVTTAAVAGAIVQAAPLAAQPALSEVHSSLQSAPMETARVAGREVANSDSRSNEVTIDRTDRDASDEPTEATAHIRGETAEARIVTDDPDFDQGAPSTDYLASAQSNLGGAGASASLFASMGTEGVMDGLLTLGQPQFAEGHLPEGGFAMAGNVLADVAGGAMIDGLLDHFAPLGQGPAFAMMSHDGMADLLSQGLGGAGGFAVFAMPEANDDASMLAAAQA